MGSELYVKRNVCVLSTLYSINPSMQHIANLIIFYEITFVSSAINVVWVYRRVLLFAWMVIQKSN